MNIELVVPDFVPTDIALNDIIIRTGTVNRAETDESDAVNDAATWRARYEQAERRIAALEAENAEQRVNMARIGIKLDDAYLRGYADAVRFVEAEAAQRAAANAEAGRGE